MLQLQQQQTAIWFLIISCIALTRAGVSEQPQQPAQQQLQSGNILPGKYHAYTQQQQQQYQKQQNTKKLHILAVAKNPHLQQQQLQQQQETYLQQPQVHAKLAVASGRQENPIKNWFGVFNRNHTRPQSSTQNANNGAPAHGASSSATANHQVSQDSMATTKTCSCR